MPSTPVSPCPTTTAEPKASTPKPKGSCDRCTSERGGLAAMGRGRARTANVLVAVLVTVVQRLGLRVGRSGGRPGWLTGVGAAVLGWVAVLVQGGSMLWRGRRPVGALVVCLAGYAVNAVLVPGVPAFAGWVAL